MPTIQCDCNWSFTDDNETTCWYEWINHDSEMYVTKDTRYHAAQIIEPPPVEGEP